MVDHEVAEILADIKRRVSSGHWNSVSERSGVAQNPERAISRSTPAGTNGYANLPVMARAWDRLPPLVSKRTGRLARLELWFKSKLKRASRWFTWEQVNFNAAAYQTFLELVESLNTCEQRLVETKQHLEALSSLTTGLMKQLEEIARLNARVEGLSQMVKDHHAEALDEQRVCYKQLLFELSESRVLQDRARRELEARFAKLEADS